MLPIKNYQYLDKDKALLVLEKICKDLNTEFCWVNSGTLLGIYRDNDFIDWDTDLDIGVISSLDRDLITLDYPILTTSKWDDRVMQIVYDIDGIHVDLWYWWEDLQDNKLITITDTGVWRMDKNIICPTKIYTWKNIKMSVPNDIEQSLLFQYADWQIPRGNKSEWYTQANNLEDFSSIKYFYEK